MQQINVNQFKTTGASSGNIPKYNGSATAWAADATGGGQVATIHQTLSGGSDDKTAIFAFVVGMCYIEILTTNNANDSTVSFASWVNLRSYSGTKTANVTNRLCIGHGDTGGAYTMEVDRDTTGTRVVVSRVNQYSTVSPVTGPSALSALNWPGAGGLRITAFEDMQA